jgi:hypothetical protein
MARPRRPANIPPDPPSRTTSSILDRLANIEARQRDYGMHNPGCPVRRTEVAQASTDVYLIAGDCDCWLSEDPGVADA